MTSYELTHFKKNGAGLRNQIVITLLKYNPVIIF